MNFKNAFFTLTFLLISAVAQAQTLESDGVAGDMDSKSRSPHLTVSSSIESNQVVILADAFHASDDFKKYPIQFEFFVNRKLISTQYRSPTLGGPIGVTVPSSVATVPFNYVVVAKMLHPNSVYTTVIEAAVTSDGTGTIGGLDCTLTLPTEGEPDLYTANNILITKTGDSEGSFTFDAARTDQAETLNVEVHFSGDSGSFVATRDGSEFKSVEGEATLVHDGSSISSITITSDDGESTLSCS